MRCNNYRERNVKAALPLLRRGIAINSSILVRSNPYTFFQIIVLEPFPNGPTLGSLSFVQTI